MAGKCYALFTPPKTIPNAFFDFPFRYETTSGICAGNKTQLKKQDTKQLSAFVQEIKRKKNNLGEAIYKRRVTPIMPCSGTIEHNVHRCTWLT